MPRSSLQPKECNHDSLLPSLLHGEGYPATKHMNETPVMFSPASLLTIGYDDDKTEAQAVRHSEVLLLRSLVGRPERFSRCLADARNEVNGLQMLSFTSSHPLR